MDISAVTAFWLVTLLLIIVPGADWAFTLSAALRGNAVLAAVGGLATGYAAMTAVVAAGIGVLVARSGMALTGITLVGGAYLIWLGLTTLRNPSTPSAGTDVDARTNRSTFAEGIGVSGLSPKGLLIMVALLPQFTSPQATWPVAAQMAALGALFTLSCAVFYVLLGTFARAVLRARPVAARALSRLSGIGMTVLGAVLITQRVLA
jgi:threonine/homoserine/homoserine lactone efflux protein